MHLRANPEKPYPGQRNPVSDTFPQSGNSQTVPEGSDTVSFVSVAPYCRNRDPGVMLRYTGAGRCDWVARAISVPTVL